MQVIVSSAFETSIGIAQLAGLASAVDQLQAGMHIPGDSKESRLATSHAPKTTPVLLQRPNGWCAHGLATENWYQRSNDQDLLQPLVGRSHLPPASAFTAEPAQHAEQSISLTAAEGLISRLCHSTAVVPKAAAGSDSIAQMALHNASLCRGTLQRESTHNISTAAGLYSFSTFTALPGQQTPTASGAADSRRGAAKQAASKPVVVFLHGFMGDKEDWAPIIQALAVSHHCIALDLPGHGTTHVAPEGDYGILFLLCC